MLQNSLAIQNRHERFIRTVCETEIVYGLENEEGFASSSSVHFEDEEENPIRIICFWAEEVLAKSCIKSDWSDYKIAKITLSDFIENWCVGMEEDGLIVGTEFDQNMFGYEADPLELILDLIIELERTNKELHFKKFIDLVDIKDQVKRILEE
ncbi:MAG: hypothetical protein K0S23_2740 [Fluviicola sp.]|jgi:hypothetical protein|uniref:DUF2750 domain-containing protein n=1 Tax=Fluviicola sp. TaxID=1917219 RepID=UPI00260D7FE1|nr:DUF2750 domain-containing protein [Fluviicola sp.]MDF3028433.1 hypothetical protein [Fluviicola sp.]